MEGGESAGGGEVAGGGKDPQTEWEKDDQAVRVACLDN